MTVLANVRDWDKDGIGRMNALNHFMEKRWYKEGDDQPVPTSGAARYFFLLRTHFGKLVTLNLLFIAFSLPVFTLPAALCGLNRTLVKLIREGHCFLWHEFFKEFKGSFVKSLCLGLVFGGGLFVAYYGLSLGLTNAESLFGTFFSAAGLFALMLAVLMGGWAFILTAMLPLGIRGILRNAWALVFLNKKCSLAVLGLGLFLWLFMLVLVPVSIVAGAFFLIAFVQYTVCFMVNEAVEVHIFAPYHAMNAGVGTIGSAAGGDKSVGVGTIGNAAGGDKSVGVGAIGSTGGGDKGVGVGAIGNAGGGDKSVGVGAIGSTRDSEKGIKSRSKRDNKAQ